MLDKKQLKRMAGTTIYHRGLDIYQREGVLEFSVESKDRGLSDRIEAMVQGSGKKRYHVELTYDYENNEIADCYCDCPAYYSYDGPCKHCVATALKYIDYQGRQNLITKLLKRQERVMGQTEQAYANLNQPYGKQNQPWQPPGNQEHAYGQFAQPFAASALPTRRTASGYSPAMRQEPQTTPAMKALLGRQMTRRSLPILQKDIYAKVSLEPTLQVAADSVSLDFRVGISHKYVVKDVFQFVDLMQRNAEFSYGQKLNFIHDISAFAFESRPLVHFLMSWAENNKGFYMQTRYNGYGYQESLAKLRTIPLKMDDLERFLDSMGNREFTACLGSIGEGRWRLTEDNLPRKLMICGKGKGVEVSMDAIPGIWTDNYFIYFKQGLIYRVERKPLEQVLDFMNCLESLPEKKAFIQESDMPAFCRELLPILEKCFRCSYENFSKEKYSMEEASFEIYLDAPEKDMVTCRVKAVYGEKKYDVYGVQSANGRIETQRDVVREMEVGTKVGDYCNAYDEKNACMVLAEDEDRLYELLTEGVAEFQTLGEVFISEALKHVRVAPAPKVEMGVSLSGDLLELTMSTEDIPLEELQEILSKYNRRKKYYRLKNGDFINMEDESLSALLELKEGLGLSDDRIGSGTVTMPKFRALYLDEASKEWEALSIEKNKEFRGLVRNMKTVEDNDFEVPETLQKILREYQKRGFLWLKTLKHNGFGGILADDMGLGKTLQVIAFLLSEYNETAPELRKPVLIVCPASLVFNWNSEIERFAPELTAKMIVGTAAERRDLLRQAADGDILLTSYDLLKRDLDAYEDMQFSCQVIDEAQYIKNHNTQVARAVKKIRAGFKLALTGTPVENRLSELWSIFDYLMPGFLHSYQRFRSTYEMPIVQGEEETIGKRLQKMIRPFVLRRLKKDVLKDLPDKMEENMYVRLEGEQQKLYDAHVKRLMLMLDKHSDEEFKRSKIQVLAELTRLRQICCDPALIYEDYKGESAKTGLCVDMIKNAVNGGHKLLVFSQFTTMLSKLCACLEAEGISYYTLTGATSKEKRKQLVEAFQQDDTSVFCISLKAGGTGLNLTAADIVMHYDPWWNLAVQNQATDRAHRIGQQNIVNVYKLIAKNTIEEKIVNLQDKKKVLAEQILGGEGMDSTDFSREELLELLKQ